MEISDLIDWESTQSHLLLNPRMPPAEKEAMLASFKSADPLSSYLWLATSGSSGLLKCAALTKEAILSSAAAVNRHLQSDSSDIWLNPLPTFHVGGLGILARGYLAQAKVITYRANDNKWLASEFVAQLISSKATLSALVPAQLFDLVQAKCSAPQSLRALIVGGGALSPKVYHEAIQLGWKLLPSYGSTECASQIATAALDSWSKSTFPALQPLDHLHINVNAEGFLQVAGSSLLTYYVYPDLCTKKCKIVDPKINGWLTTDDQVTMEKGLIKSINRGIHFVKIGGESVDLVRLDMIIDELKLALQIQADMSIFPFPDERLGHILCLAVASPVNLNLEPLLERYHVLVHPYERIRSVRYVTHIPRTASLKVIRTF